jgi:hypothetical protein
MNRHAGTGSWNALQAAKRDVTRAENALSRRLAEAGVAGQATVDRALALVRPLVIGAVAVAGVVWLVSALRRPRRRAFVPPAHRRPLLMNEALRAASLTLATAAARHLGEHLFANPDTTQSTPSRRAVPPRNGNNPPRL